MATYQTHQKKDLIAFLEKHSDRSFTIEELAASMQADSSLKNPPGKSTIYRIMPSLLDSHLVTRFQSAADRKAAYQIVGGSSCHGHMHMKCTGCGRLLHMSDAQSQLLLQQIQRSDHFALDLTQTLLYGTCDRCSGIATKEEATQEAAAQEAATKKAAPQEAVQEVAAQKAAPQKGEPNER